MPRPFSTESPEIEEAAAAHLTILSMHPTVSALPLTLAGLRDQSAPIPSAPFLGPPCQLVLLRKRVYNLCSKAVHTGRLKHGDASSDLIDQARNVCRNALIRHIREGVRPDEEYWSALVVGMAK